MAEQEVRYHTEKQNINMKLHHTEHNSNDTSTKTKTHAPSTGEQEDDVGHPWKSYTLKC